VRSANERVSRDADELEQAPRVAARPLARQLVELDADEKHDRADEQVAGQQQDREQCRPSAT
jgi:hypothetical protein